MRDILAAIGETLGLLLQTLFGGGAAAVRYSRLHARWYFRFIAFTTAIVVMVPFLLVILKVFFGWAWAAHTAAFLGAFFVLALGAFYVPLAAWVGVVLIAYHGLTWSGTLSPVELGRRYIRKVLVALFIELLVGVYVILVPLDQNPGLFSVLLLLGAAIAVGSFLWGGFGSGLLFTRLAIAAAVLVTLFLVVKANEFLPGPKPQVVCVPDFDRPLLQVLALQGPKRPVRVKLMQGPIAKYEIDRGEVEGDLVIDFRDGSQDTWRGGEQRRDDHWRTAPVRLYGSKGSVAKVTLFKQKCEEVPAKK